MEEVAIPEINEICLSTLFTNEEIVKEAVPDSARFDLIIRFFPHLLCELKETIDYTEASLAFYQVAYLHQVNQGWINPKTKRYHDKKDSINPNPLILSSWFDEISHKKASDYELASGQALRDIATKKTKKNRFWYYLSIQIFNTQSELFKDKVNGGFVMEEYLETHLIPLVKRKLKKIEFPTELVSEHRINHVAKITELEDKD